MEATGTEIKKKGGRPIPADEDKGTKRPKPPRFEGEDSHDPKSKKAAPKPTKEPKKKASASGITQAYLIWVGSDHYKSIADWSDEAIMLGISKRLPNVAMARQLNEPGTVIFVAHDEGNTTECNVCLGSVECPDCRKRLNEQKALRGQIDKMKAAFKGEDFDAEAPQLLKRFKTVREKSIAALEEECKDCDLCGGKGHAKLGTGGTVKLTDGRVWDYRTYNYWLHQPKKFNPETMVAEVKMCEACGGKGELPNAKIFGIFAPERIEYIVSGEESKDELKAYKGFTFVKSDALKVEAERKCGRRKPGGLYAVTTVSGERGLAVLDDAIKEGLLKKGGATVHGSFVRFGRPVPVAEKRFRGLKKVDLKTIKSAVDQALMVKEALED